MTKIQLKNLIQNATEQQSDADRREAVIALGYEKGPDILPVLVRLLNDPDTNIQQAAVISLERLGNPEALAELIQPHILQSPDAAVRCAVVTALGRLGRPDAVRHLLSLARDPAWIVRNHAIKVLKSKMGQISGVRETATVDTLMRIVLIGDPELTALAVDGLLDLGQWAEAPLRDRLKDPSARIRQYAAVVLGKRHCHAAVSDLAGLLQDPDAQVRESAAESLGLIADETAVIPLIRCITDHSESVQQAAVRALIRFGTKSTGPLMAMLTHERSPYVVQAIIHVLGAICDPASMNTLVPYLKSCYFVVRKAAVEALVKFGFDVIEHLTPYLQSHPVDEASLIESARGRYGASHQLNAVHALGDLELYSAVSILKLLAAQAESRTLANAANQALDKIGCAAWGRCGCLQIIRLLGDKTVLPYCIHALHDLSAHVRLEAARTLSIFRDEESVAALVSAAEQDSEADVRLHALQSLRVIGQGNESVFQAAQKALHDKDRDVRVQAAGLLGAFHDARAVEPLREATGDTHWRVRQSAEVALENLM